MGGVLFRIRGNGRIAVICYNCRRLGVSHEGEFHHNHLEMQCKHLVSAVVARCCGKSTPIDSLAIHQRQPSSGALEPV